MLYINTKEVQQTLVREGVRGELGGMLYDRRHENECHVFSPPPRLMSSPPPSLSFPTLAAFFHPPYTSEKTPETQSTP